MDRMVEEEAYLCYCIIIVKSLDDDDFPLISLLCAGNSTLMNPLKQCCDAEIGNNCGSVDDKGEKKYSVCENPGLSFFWDNVHPSQNGWNAVYTLLQPSLGQLTQKNF